MFIVFKFVLVWMLLEGLLGLKGEVGGGEVGEVLFVPLFGVIVVVAGGLEVDVFAGVAAAAGVGVVLDF